MYRVIQWATGNVGRAAIRGILAHPELELAGVYVHGADKEGRDAGELAGAPKAGVSATRDVEAILATKADCVLYSPLLAKPDEVKRIVASGKNVVTPLGWFYPGASAAAAELHAACVAAGVTLHGTGIHPGGITERFPLMVSALSKNVRHVRAEEFSDIRSYRAKDVVREVMLFGKAPEQAAKSPMLRILAGGFMQSIDMLAAGLGMDLDSEKRTRHEMAVATAPIATPVGTLEKGTVAAQRFAFEGTVRGETVISVRVNWLMGQEQLDPPWRYGSERFEVEVTGDPTVKVDFHGLHPHDWRDEAALADNPGIAATAIHCVSAIPYVCRAEPGIQTYLDLPLVCGRADASLRSAGRA